MFLPRSVVKNKKKNINKMNMGSVPGSKLTVACYKVHVGYNAGGAGET